MIRTALALPPNYETGFYNSPLLKAWDNFHQDQQKDTPEIIGGERFRLCEPTTFPYIYLIDTDEFVWEQFARWVAPTVQNRLLTAPTVHLYGDVNFLQIGNRRWLTIITPREMPPIRADAWVKHYWGTTCKELQPTPSPLSIR